mmetsp:Transcript_18017/g.68314  ORF Transcript_18017/g.68314 Transcript_18017/m.68314 type:complete len:328 (-) Transcript_18017:1286-2269(-)
MPKLLKSCAPALKLSATAITMPKPKPMLAKMATSRQLFSRLTNWVPCCGRMRICTMHVTAPTTAVGSPTVKRWIGLPSLSSPAPSGQYATIDGSDVYSPPMSSAPCHSSSPRSRLRMGPFVPPKAGSHSHRYRDDHPPSFAPLPAFPFGPLPAEPFAAFRASTATSWASSLLGGALAPQNQSAEARRSDPPLDLGFACAALSDPVCDPPLECEAASAGTRNLATVYTFSASMLLRLDEASPLDLAIADDCDDDVGEDADDDDDDDGDDDDDAAPPLREPLVLFQKVVSLLAQEDLQDALPATYSASDEKSIAVTMSKLCDSSKRQVQ